MEYVYPAIFIKEGNAYCVNFPDFENTKNPCFTDGKDLKQALSQANDVLCLTLYEIEQANGDLPVPSSLESIKHGKDEFVQFVNCDTDWYKRYFERKAVKKNLTIPARLAALAERDNVNFSAVLTDALIKRYPQAHKRSIINS
jgi:predicted RNase H-like HicB family nuclease